MADAGQQTVTIQQALDLAVQHHSEGRLPEAEGLYQQILQADPNQPVALHLLGLIAHQVGKNDIAFDLITKALAVEPDYAEAHCNLGLVLHGLGKLDEAVASYHKALVIKPDYAEAHFNLGSLLQKLGRLEDAVVSYHKAIVIKPDYAEAHNVLGNTLVGLGRLDDAISSYHKALVIKPDYAEAHNNLGNTLKDQGRLEDAVACYRKALAIKPNIAEAHYNLGNALSRLGRLQEAIVSFRGALDIKPNFAEGWSNLIFTLGYLPEISGADILQETKQWEAHCGFKGDIPEHQNVPDSGRRLRIGLMSSDLRHHAVSYFLQNVLSEIDKDQLEFFAYATATEEDDMTARLKAIVPHWRQASSRSDQQLAEDIIADGIDVLVDLSGHTANNRLPVFSRTPAPVQVAWLGYSGTTGVEAVDYILCDPLILPACDETHFSEKPWRLPDIWVCFSPPTQDIAVGPPPVLANGYVTFGSFNTLNKVSDRTVACWASILEAVPHSRLLLKAKQLDDATVQEAIHQRFAAHGIDRQRIILKKIMPDRLEHLSAYREMDIALDPFPYTGTTTSVEALWMGVPLLTLSGDRFGSRAGESILHNVELDAWIADTPEDYVEKAKALAADLPALAALRASLRGRLLASPVCDAVRFAGNLEDAFRGMWREWCGKRRV